LTISVMIAGCSPNPITYKDDREVCISASVGV
jgi:hypothetical protein